MPLRRRSFCLVHEKRTLLEADCRSQGFWPGLGDVLAQSSVIRTRDLVSLAFDSINEQLDSQHRCANNGIFGCYWKAPCYSDNVKRLNFTSTCGRIWMERNAVRSHLSQECFNGYPSAVADSKSQDTLSDRITTLLL
jgi:hypothetical protein